MVRVGKTLLEKPVLDWRQRNRSHCHTLFIRRTYLAQVSHWREFGYGLMFEYLSVSKPNSSLMRSGYESEPDDGISPQLEEVIVNAHSVDAKQFLPDFGDHLLNLISGSHVQSCCFRTGVSLLSPSGLLGG
jgi:hypothetical protein